MAAQRFYVKGRVQQVGFRAYVLGVAQELEFGGEVWNSRDGNVEIIVFSDDEALFDELEKRLWLGPGYVESVDRRKSLERGSAEFSIGLAR